MSGGGPAAALRDALEVIVAAGEIPAAVRGEIGASWQRSARTGLRPDRFEVPHDPDIDADAWLVRAARPVLDQLAEDLVPTKMSVVLTDGQARLLDRRVSDTSLMTQLDRISLAPGFLYAEDAVGTNAIGTAVRDRRPSVVDGAEHFADALTAMACAAAPITDPRNGRVLGAVDLTCRASDTSPLMLPLVQRAVREIEQRLVDDARIPERALLQRFMRERQRTKGPFVFISERRMITNAAAERLVGPTDEIVLRERAAQLLATGTGEPVEVVLVSGEVVTLRCEAVLDGAVPVGALLRPTPGPRSEGSSTRSTAALGWDSLTDTERSVVDLVARGHTNRQAAEQLFMSRHTVDSHLRSVFRKLDISSRVDLTRLSVERGPGAPTRP